MLTPDYPVVDRRHFLKHMAGFSLMALPGFHFVQALRANADKMKKANKSLIVLWMSGGPSHMDIFDMKPGEPTGGEFKPISTTASGVQICEHMPETAKQMKHLSIIRSLVTNEGSHDRGRVLLHTARQPSPITQWPSIGSVVSHQLTEKSLDLPGFISIGRPADGPGFLGMNYAPFTVQDPGSPPQNMRVPSNVDIQRRQRLIRQVEDTFVNEKRGDAAKAHSEVYGKAFNLVASPRGKVFDLSTEPRSLIEEYAGTSTGQRMGNNAFGRGCLLARKLVEAGVTAVEVDLGGWDNHNNIFPTLKDQRLPALDRGMAALVRDLVDRGMWKNTVLVWMGEFGRTPRINQNAGRDHWARCWSVVVGGGALKEGIVYGSTDRDGTSVQDNPCSVGDLFATLYKALGMDPALQIRDNLGRPQQMAPGKPIADLLNVVS